MGGETNQRQAKWAVSYHGTKMTNIRSISATGYKTSKSEREEYGKGIYSTPSIEVAAGYATEFSHEGRKYKMVFAESSQFGGINPSSCLQNR